MSQKKSFSDLSSKPSPPEIEDLEQILRGYNLSPGKRLYEILAGQAWMAGVEKERGSTKAKRLRLVSIVAAIAVVFFMITPL